MQTNLTMSYKAKKIVAIGGGEIGRAGYPVETTTIDREIIRLTGLGFITATHSPHYDVEKDRRAGLKKVMRKTPGIALAIDNCAAIEFVNDTYRLITSKPRAKAYKTYWKKGHYHEEKLPKQKTFKPLADLLAK